METQEAAELLKRILPDMITEHRRKAEETKGLDWMAGFEEGIAVAYKFVLNLLDRKA